MTMEQIYTILERISAENKKDLLTNILYGLALLSIPLVICSLVASSTANAGFNIVFTSLLNCCFVAGAYYVIQNSKTPIAIGFLIGCCAMLASLNFMDAIYWGQLSYCTTYDMVIGQYSCSHPAAYGAICFFSVFLFLAQVLFVCILYISRGELISEEGLYEHVSSGHTLYEPQSRGHLYAQAPSADL